LEISGDTLLLLFLIASLAGFMDTLAGGGGLITIPALALTGAPMLAVLGTNKLQGCVGTATASTLLYRNKKFTFAEIKSACLYAFAGAMAGSLLVQFINKETLKFIVPVVLFMIGIYFLLSPYLKIHPTEALVSKKQFNRTIVPGIGFYDGMFGPGTGSFFSLAGVSLRSQTLIQATTFAKPFNFATNIASLIVFISLGQVIWRAGFAMMAGQMLGAALGSSYLYKIKPELLRLLVVTVCFTMLSNYVYRELFK
jgi:uncharacterized protein